MPKSLNLTTAEQSLAVDGIPVRYQFTPKDGNAVLYDGVIEINELAAQDIEYNALGFKYLIAIIRRYRLMGKSDVENSESDFAAVAQPFIDYLNAL